MTDPFVPGDFIVPTQFEGDGFRFEPLGPEHNERDHTAWMSSIEHIHATPGYERSEWPEPMGLGANLRDLERHARDFANRDGFTYSVLVGDEVIGALYIYPALTDDHDARVKSWVSASNSAMDVTLWSNASVWLATRWPFTNPDYASRG